MFVSDIISGKHDAELDEISNAVSQRKLKHALEILEQVDFSKRSAGTPYNRRLRVLIEGGALSQGLNIQEALKHAIEVLKQVDFSDQDVEYDKINWNLIEDGQSADVKNNSD